MVFADPAHVAAKTVPARYALILAPPLVVATTVGAKISADIGLSNGGTGRLLHNAADFADAAPGTVLEEESADSSVNPRYGTLDELLVGFSFWSVPGRRRYVTVVCEQAPAIEADQPCWATFENEEYQFDFKCAKRAAAVVIDRIPFAQPSQLMGILRVCEYVPTVQVHRTDEYVNSFYESSLYSIPCSRVALRMMC